MIIHKLNYSGNAFKISFLGLLVIISVERAFAQDSTLEREFIYFPKPLAAWEFEKTIGFSLTYLPKIIVEEEINQSPLIDANFSMGLPYNFCLNGRISAIYITNQFLLGVQWRHAIDNFAFSFGYDLAYWVGQFKQKAFDVIANGTMNYPYISIGYDFDDFYASLKFEWLVSTFEETFAGETTVGGVKRELVGYAITYALEQPFWKNTNLLQGVKLNITKFFYQSWIAFTRTDRFILFPEFIIGFHI